MADSIDFKTDDDGATHVKKLRELEVVANQAVDAAVTVGQAVVDANAAANRAAQGGIYPTISDALQPPPDGVPEGGYFSVPSADDETYLVLYQNVGGAAVEQKRYPSSTAVAAGLSAVRLNNQFPDPGLRDDVLPDMRSGGVASLVAITDPVLTSMGVKNGFRSTATATFAVIPVKEGWIGRYVIMTCIVHYEDGVTPPTSTSRSGFLLADKSTFERTGLTTSTVVLSEKSLLVIVSGAIPPNAAYLAIGSGIGSPSPQRMIALPGYAISDSPIKLSAFKWDVTDPLVMSNPGVYSTRQDGVMRTAPGDMYLQTDLTPSGNVVVARHDESGAVEDVKSLYASTKVDEIIAPIRLDNRYPDSGFASGSLPEMRSGTPTLYPISDEYLVSIGAINGVTVEPTTSNYCVVPVLPEWHGKWVIMTHVVHHTDGSTPSTSSSRSGFLLSDKFTFDRTGLTASLIEIDASSLLVVVAGKITESADYLAIGSGISSPSAEKLITAVCFGVSDVPVGIESFAWDVLYPVSRTVQPEPPTPNNLAFLSIPESMGEDGYVIGQFNGVDIKRTFRLGSTDALSYPAFNFSQDVVDGVVVRSVIDDIAPYRAESGTLGANHSYYISRVTAAGHGKTQADRGAVYERDGVQYLLIRELSANQLLMTTVADDFIGTVPVGTYTHVSGGVSSTPIVVTATESPQWYSAMQNRQLRILCDGEDITEQYGTFGYDKCVEFLETYELVSKEDLVNWWMTDGSTGVEFAQGLPPVFAVSLRYRFDVRGQCTVFSEFVALKDTSIENTRKNFMALQAQIAGMETYYIPKALPFTHGGVPLNYAMGEPADITMSMSLPDVELTHDKCEPTGILCDRIIAKKSSGVFTMGFLPVAGAEIEERRTNAFYKALQVRGNTGKIYMNAYDMSGDILERGTCFSVVGYRNIAPASANRTSMTIVETSGVETYLYADWHDWEGVDVIELPQALSGKSIDVVEQSGNVQLLSRVATGRIFIRIDAESDYGYLVAKIL